MDKEHFDEIQENIEELQTNELDDIVLERYEKKNRIKRYLLLGGSALLVFIIVISIVKMVTDSSSAPQEALIEPEQLSQELSSEENFEEVPILPEEKTNDDEFKQVIEEVMKKEEKITVTSITSQKMSSSSTSSIAHQKKSSPTQKAKPNPIEASKQTIQSKPKPKPKQASKSKHTGSIYIQVGAFLRYGPSNDFLKKIKKSGFDYVIKEFTINGKKIKRVYVGPFKSKKEAAKYLPKIKKTISKNAFITKVK